ncbi:type II/IV secretion system protein [Candidatus Woesebacteria bacterium]|nr:type II/IV secretion system protein [Candidatus Woesebacteria bacterium]
MLSPKVYLASLVEAGYLDQVAADRLELESLQTGKEIETLVLSYNLAPKDALLSAKAKCLNVQSVNIENTAVNPAAINLISRNLATHYKIIPYQVDLVNKVIKVATGDPLNLNLQNFLEQKTGYHVTLCLGYPQDIEKAIPTAYTQSLAPDVTQALANNQDSKVETPSASPKDQKSQNISESPITKIMDTILQFASQSRASDIHIEPQTNQTRVRYRIDGILQEKLVLPGAIHESLVSRLKIMSGLKLDERRVPQDGRFSFKANDTEIDVRVSTLPLVFGEKIVMRLLRKSGGLPTLPELGLQNMNLKLIQSAIEKPYGIVLVTGPTGAGKTTTLYSILTILNKPTTNIVTLEDPVEYQIAGINQVQINPQAGLTFATGLRSFLRQDPNIILVGEIRDGETTQLAVQAALTGHLVFSTLHTNNAATAIPRLIDLGAEPFLISSVLVASIAQRIARKICERCKIQYKPAPEIQQQVSQIIFGKSVERTDSITLYKGTGCDACDHTGFHGRIGLFEVLTVSSAVNKLILQHSSAEAIEAQAVADGMLTMRQDGYLKALSGYTTLEEVIRLTDVK